MCHLGDIEDTPYEKELLKERKMKRPYNGIYDDKEYCMRELLLARKVFGDIKTTKKVYKKMCDGLALVFLYCPKEIKPLVNATIVEATMRYTYFEKIWDIRELSNG